MRFVLRSRFIRGSVFSSVSLVFAASAFAVGKAQVTVLDPTPGATVLRCTLDGFESRDVAIGGAQFSELSVAGEGYLDVVGAPRLPHVCRSVVIPDTQDVVVRVVGSRYHDVANVAVAPARGPISRTQDPSSVPYVFGASYSTDAWYPGELATAREPYILRDVRGAVVEFDALQYDAATKVLRVYDELVVRVETAGPARADALVRAGAPDRSDAEFEQIYSHQFVNYTSKLGVPLNESGGMLVIAPAAYFAELQPLVDWKNSRGISTKLVDVASIGNNATAIKSYVNGYYATNNLSFVLLVGDIANVASGSYAGGASDPFFSTLTPDVYPDILVGRFSAQNVAQVKTQVERTIRYEQMNHALSAGGWNTWAMGVASDQGPGHFGEYDFQHMDLIRQKLLNYGYSTVDQIYDPTATKAMVANGLNAGRRMVDYCGHGSETSWGTTGWSNSDVAALTNFDHLPIVDSVACVNGNFALDTCFAEAWLRSTKNGQAIGAVGAYMSSIDQYWNEPMYGQDAAIDYYVAEAYWSLGGLWFASSAKMIDITGSSGVDMFMTWICFGDPSLRVLGLASDPPTAYCTSKTNSLGGAPKIGWYGSTSVTAGDFHLTCNLGVPAKNAIHFFGTSPQASPFYGGTLCVMPPLVRGPVKTFDSYGTMVEAIPFAAPQAGLSLYFQYWGRDPQHPDGTGVLLSNALRVDVVP